jgi:hypothetical protein
MNLCRSCSDDLSSVERFDRHRVGLHEYLWSLNHEHGRRCLSTDELEALGSTKNVSGRWHDPVRCRAPGRPLRGRQRGRLSRRPQPGHTSTSAAMHPGESTDVP